jgi:prepilin-type N-terminal cleavage/methylation domain-containing protein
VRQRGFTLIELMVVVTCIAVVASVATPRVLRYVRDSRAREVSTTLIGLDTALKRYQRMMLLRPDKMKDFLDHAMITPGRDHDDELFLPNFELPKDPSFEYEIRAKVGHDGPKKDQVVYCITAKGLASAGLHERWVLYSSVPTRAPGWEGNINRWAFVQGLKELKDVEKGGYCNDNGDANDHCISC